MSKLEESYVVSKRACPRCRSKGRDRSGDNLVVYSDGGMHCFSCEYHIGKGYAPEFDEEMEREVSTKEAITPDENKQLKEQTTIVDFRGIRKDTAKFFGVRYEMDTETGEIARQLYPTTIDGELVGYKSRHMPKDFSRPIGIVGRECDLIGQYRFRTGGKMCLIVGGEVDQLSAYQMLKDNQSARGKGDYESVAVVSSTVGEKSGWKQIQKQYSFFDQFEKIIIALDNDEAGREAAQKYIEVLPRGKVFMINWRYKDPNKYLVDGKEQEFIQDFWKMRKATPAGVMGSGDIQEKMLEEANLVKIPFPPFLKRLNELTYNGIALGRIVNIGAASGIGKTILVNEMIYYWIFHCPYQMGIVSMELNAGQYGLSILSRHIGKKLSRLNPDEKMEYLLSEDGQKAQQNLFFRENGEHRFHLMDDRDGSVEALQNVVEELVISCGCRVIVLDVLQDILDGLTNEEQAVFLKWQKGLIKSHNITFININHVRKSSGNQTSNSEGKMISEEDFAGSSTIFKSASLNILLQRNKMAEDEIERNTTYVYLSKNREDGDTGPAGELFYDKETHTLWDKGEYFAEHGPSGF